MPLQRFLELLQQYMQDYSRNRSTLDRYIVGAFRDLAENGPEWVSTYNWGDTQIVLAEQLKKAHEVAGQMLANQISGLPSTYFAFVHLLRELSDDELVAVAERLLQGLEFAWHQSETVFKAVFMFRNALDNERLWVELA